MRRGIRHLPIAAFLVLPLLFEPVAAGLVVDSWIIGTGVYDTQSPSNPSEEDFSLSVENPFDACHRALLNDSSSTAAYDFSWTGDVASFGLNVSHHLEQLDGRTTTSGRIYITPSVDSIVTFSGTWEFAWPSAAIGSTQVSLHIFDLATENSIASAIGSGGNLGLGPPFGSFSIGGSEVIRSGGHYLLYYSAHVSHVDPTPPGTFGEASGNIHFTITPIPEPASLALLSFASLALPRRISRRRPRSA